MKALLLTVLIILVILVILIYYLNQYTVKKPVIKEQFYGDAGDVYSLQSGTSEFETVTKLESDVNNIIVKQEQNTSDLSAFKTDTTNQLSTLNTGFGQFKTDASNKLTVLQENSVNQRTILDVYGNNINDLTSRFKGANDKIAVVDGKLVSITTDQQKQLDSLTSNYKTLNDTQNAFYGVIDNKKQEALKYTDDSISKLSTSLNKSIADESRLINNTNTQFSSLQNDYTKFKADTSKIDGDQQSAINSVLTKASTLNDAINAAQNRINDVAATFKNYISRDQLGNFVLKAELQPYATQNQLQNYSLKTDSANFITLNELNQYVKKTDNKPTIDSLTTANNSITNLNSQVKNIQSDYVQKATLGSYVKTDDLKPINDSLSGANSAIGSLNSQLNNIKGDYVPKATLGSYVTTANLKPTIDSLNAANAALQNLSTTVSTVLNNYVTKADLPKLAMDATGITVLSQALDGMKNAVASLSNTIADVKSSLSNYVLKSDWQAANANFALKTDLSGYVPTSQMTNYYSKKDVDTATNNIGSQINAINTNISQNVAMKNDLAGYVPNSQLTNFYSKKDIDASNGNINSQINAINTNISQNVALKNDLKGYVQLSQLPQWPNKADIDALTANFNSQISTIKAGTSQILDIMQINTTLKTDQLIATKGLWNTSMPKGLTGVHTTDLYGEGTVATGTGGNINAYMNSAGNAKIGAKLGVGIDPSAMGGQTFRVDTPTGDWQAFFHNPNGERNALFSHGDGYGMHINTNDQRPDHYSQQLHNGKWVTKQVNNDGLQVNSAATGDWAWRFNNQNGNRNIYAVHGDGFGMHINANDQRGDHYGLQVWNGKKENLTVFNDGQIRWNNRAGDWTHFNHPDENGKNYIRGPTQFDGPYTRLNANVSTPNGHVWGGDGRQHIGAGELLYLLPKNGVEIGKEWGGNGNLNAQGTISTPTGIKITNNNPGSLIEKNYGANDNRYGVGQFDNGATRVYTANKTAYPGTVNLSLANKDGSFDDIVRVNPDRSTDINGPLRVNKGDGNWNWLQVTGNYKDNISLGSDGGNRGIWADGNRNFSIYNQGTPGLTVDTAGNAYTAGNQIKFSKGWTGYPDNALLQSEISNDPGGGLMIVGNKLNDKNKPRTVGVWDVLNVNGTTNANGQLNANGNVRLNGTVSTPNGHVWGGDGRQHISAGELLYLLPKNGVEIGREWGGNGNLHAQGQISAPDFRAGPNTGGRYPGGWSGGVMAWDIYAGGTIAVGDLNGGVDRAFSRGGVANLSDIRTKENISVINNNDLDAINSLNPIKFTKKNDPEKKIHFGYSAQDVEKVYPNLISELPDGYKGMNYEELIPIIAGNVKNIKQSLPDKETLCLGDVCINKDQLRQIKYALESKSKA